MGEMSYNKYGDVDMGLSYLLIKGIKQLNIDDEATLSNLLLDMMPTAKIEIEQDFLSVILKESYSYNFSDIIFNTNAELYTNLSLYESSIFSDYDELIKDKSFKMMQLRFDRIYLNDKILFYERILDVIDDAFKRQVLKEFYDDPEFLNTIKVFIEKNQNTSEASKFLYLHRNTLINRIEKFYRVTGYDLKKFEDAAIVYLLVKDAK